MRAVTNSCVMLTVGVVFAGCGGSDSSSTGGIQGLGGDGSVGGTTGASEVHPVGGATQTSGSRTATRLSTSGTSPSLGGTTGTFSTHAPHLGGGSTVIGGAATSAGSSATTGGTSSVAGATSAGTTGDAKPSRGCGKTPTLKNSPSTPNQNTLTIAGKSRQFLIRWPDNYDKNHPYRLVIALHGATGKDTDRLRGVPGECPRSLVFVRRRPYSLTERCEAKHLLDAQRILGLLEPVLKHTYRRKTAASLPLR